MKKELFSCRNAWKPMNTPFTAGEARRGFIEARKQLRKEQARVQAAGLGDFCGSVRCFLSDGFFPYIEIGIEALKPGFFANFLKKRRL